MRAVATIVLLAIVPAALSAADDRPKVAVFTHRYHVEVKESAGAFDLNSDFTIELWAAWENLPRDEYFAGNWLWESRDGQPVPGSETGWVIRKTIREGAALLEFAMAIDGGGWLIAAGECPAVRGTQHIAACRAGNTLLLWLNGRKIGGTLIRGARAKNSPHPFYLGPRNNGDPRECFDGEIFGFHVAIGPLYRKPFKPARAPRKIDSSIVLFDLRGSPDDRLEDSSGNGHDGILAGVKIIALETRREDQRKAAIEERQALRNAPPLNLRIIEFGKLNLGRMVWNGDCWRFVEEATKYAGAKRRDVYIWGERIAPELAQPGDIVQLQNPGGASGHHSAIVWRNRGNGQFVLLNSNAPPYGPYAGMYEFQLSDERREVLFYRPE
jgi:hypothetical protein